MAGWVLACGASAAVLIFLHLLLLVRNISPLCSSSEKKRFDYPAPSPFLSISAPAIDRPFPLHASSSSSPPPPSAHQNFAQHLFPLPSSSSFPPSVCTCCWFSSAPSCRSLSSSFSGRFEVQLSKCWAVGPPMCCSIFHRFVVDMCGRADIHLTVQVHKLWRGSVQQATDHYPDPKFHVRGRPCVE